jgi:hypothetical protein
MRYRTRSITWHGQAFHFQRFQSKGNAAETVEWAVSHGPEFIGVMPCSPEVTTREFDVRCSNWLAELLGHAESETANPKP